MSIQVVPSDVRIENPSIITSNDEAEFERNRPRNLYPEEIMDIVNNLPEMRGIKRSVRMAHHSLKQTLFLMLLLVKITSLAIEDGSFKQEIYRQFKSSLVRIGTMVGAQAADAVSAPIMQMTLNTFHTTGAAKNVTSGFAAIRELIKASDKLKNPSCTISFRNKHLTFDDILDKKQPQIVGLIVSQLVTSRGLDAISQYELFGADLEYPFWYQASSSILGKEILGPDRSRYIMRLTLDVDVMYKYRVTADEVCRSMENDSSNPITCIYSPIVWEEDVQAVIDENDAIINEKIQVPRIYVDIFPHDHELDDIGKVGMSAAGRENKGLFFLQTVIIPSLDAIKIKGVTGIHNLYPVEEPVWAVVNKEEHTPRDGHPNLWVLHYDRFIMRMSGISPINVINLCRITGMVTHPFEQTLNDNLQVEIPDKSTIPDFDEVAKIDPEKVKNYITPGELIAYYVNKDRLETREKEQQNRDRRNELLRTNPVEGMRFVTQVPTTDIYRASKFVYADTNGSNLRELLIRDDVDPNHTYSNNMYDILSIFGVEAVRNYMMWALFKMIKASGQEINIRHMMLLVDYMTFAGGVSKATFSGTRSHSSVLTSASYQQSMKTIGSASAFGESDPMTSVSSDIFTGKKSKIGYDIKVTDEMMEKIVQMSNAADEGDIEQIDPDDFAAAIRNQEEVVDDPSTKYGGPAIPMDENDAIMMGLGMGDDLDDVIPQVDIRTQIQKQEEAREKVETGMGIGGIIGGLPAAVSNAKPAPLENAAAVAAATSIEEVTCEPPTFENVRIEPLFSGIAPEDLPDPNRPEHTQITVAGLRQPQFGVNINESIGVPAGLQELIQRGLSLRFTSGNAGLGSSGRLSDRAFYLKTLLDEYSKTTQINISAYLDIGCGSGEITREIGRVVNAKMTYGADIEMQTCPNFILVQDDKISLSDNSVDLITSYVTLHHFSDYGQMLLEISRVIRNGGLLFIREHDSNVEHQPYLDMVHVIEAIGRDEDMVTYIPSFVSNYWSKRDLIQSLRDYGLMFVSEKSYPGNVPNPQRIYHALFVKDDSAQKQIPYNPTPVKSEYILNKYNMLDWIKQKPKPYYDQLTRYIRKKLGINPRDVNRIVSESTSDIDLYQRLTANKKT